MLEPFRVTQNSISHFSPARPAQISAARTRLAVAWISCSEVVICRRGKASREQSFGIWQGLVAGCGWSCNTVDGQTPAPPKTPWETITFVIYVGESTHFRVSERWCETDFATIHTMSLESGRRLPAPLMREPCLRVWATPWAPRRLNLSQRVRRCLSVS